MNKIFALFVMFFFASKTIAKDFDYRDVAMAGTGGVGSLFVRYLISFNDTCLLIQNLVPGKLGAVSAQKKICSLEGKRFDSGYSAIDFKEGTFKDGKLLFEVGVTPLEPVGETIMSCEVIFVHELPDHLSCKKKEDFEEGSRTCP